MRTFFENRLACSRISHTNLKKSYGDSQNRNFEKSHRTTGPQSDLRADSWSCANSGIDTTSRIFENGFFEWRPRQVTQRHSTSDMPVGGVPCRRISACTKVVLKYCILDWWRISEFVSFKKTSARKLSKHSVCIITHICYYILVNISVLILINKY